MTTALQRATPRRAKTQERLRELLKAARQVFAEQGYRNTTIAQIGQAAGVSEATVFTYFPGKRELCMVVIRDWYDEISSTLEQEVPRLPGLQARLAYVIRAHLHTLLADGSGMCALVLGEGRAAEPELSKVITECKRRYTAPLMETLAQAQKAGEIRQDVPLRLLRDLIYGSMEHVLWDAITSARRPRVDVTAQQLSSLIWSALMPANPSVAALARFRAEVAQALRGLEQFEQRLT